jgi:ATP-dependent DNA helicase RecG
VYAGEKRLPSESIIVGTTGMATVARKCGYIPNFMIIDEQHKMAVAARKSMVGPHTHVLEASATPIPHALANTLYAGTQMLVLRQAPVERSIHSRVYDDSERSEISRHIRQAIDGGGRVMIIYPRVNAAQDASVEQAAANLSAILPGKVGFLHGKLPDSTVQKTLQDFRDGHIPLLVASTIVETGIDVPDVRLLIVREADRFGIAQLHQLRGRLARNGGQAHFAMHVDRLDELNDETVMRLEAVAEMADGFALAEEDMRQRGFGDLLGEQQNGGISLPMRLLNMTASEVDAETQAMEAAFSEETSEPLTSSPA